MKTMKSDATVKRHLRELRRLIDDPATDAITARVAYAMECAVQWARSPRGEYGPGLAKEATQEADILRKELP